MNKGIKFVCVALLIFCTTTIFASCDESEEAFSSVTVNSRITSSEFFVYETSLTDSISNKKADVYKSSLSVNESVGEIEKIEASYDKKELVKDKAIMLNYKDEEILVYEGESGETYVQISPEEYVQNQGYRSSYRPGGFFHTYGVISAIDDISRTFKSNRTSKKKQFSNSIRNSSTGSRKSSGGGTSFGK